jgi:hypothetical protein
MTTPHECDKDSRWLSSSGRFDWRSISRSRDGGARQGTRGRPVFRIPWLRASRGRRRQPRWGTPLGLVSGRSDCLGRTRTAPFATGGTSSNPDQVTGRSSAPLLCLPEATRAASFRDRSMADRWFGVRRIFRQAELGHMRSVPPPGRPLTLTRQSRRPRRRPQSIPAVWTRLTSPGSRRHSKCPKPWAVARTYFRLHCWSRSLRSTQSRRPPLSRVDRPAGAALHASVLRRSLAVAGQPVRGRRPLSRTDSALRGG